MASDDPDAGFAGDLGASESRPVDTAGKIDRMPNQPKTPVRGFRIPDALYFNARELSEIFEETLTDEVNRALRRYVKRRLRDLDRMDRAERERRIRQAAAKKRGQS